METAISKLFKQVVLNVEMFAIRFAYNFIDVFKV